MGLRPGVTLASARARAPLLRAEPMDAAADARFLRRFAEACEIFTPLVALDPPAGVVLDVTGCAHLFGGEAALRWRAGARLARLGLSALRGAVAGAPDAARALGRFSQRDIVAPGEESVAARDLPLAALEVESDALLALSRAGFTTLGDLEARDSAALAARFGMALTRKLDRIFGREDIRITPLRAPPDCMAERHFPEPVASADALLGALDALVASLAGQLERQGLGGRLFEAQFFRADGALRRLRVETARPSRDAASLMRLFRLRLETLADPLDPGFGFDAIRLGALRSERLAPAQHLFEGRAQEDEEIADLIDRLTTRFGRDRVLLFMARDTHDPTRAAGAAPAGDRPARAPDWQAPEPGAPPRRPLQMFNPPQPIEVMAETPDAPPLRFRWRRVLHEVARAEGPERLAPEWWRDASPGKTRDYYRVEDGEGSRFWLFREGLYEEEPAPRWFLHGLFA